MARRAAKIAGYEARISSTPERASSAASVSSRAMSPSGLDQQVFFVFPAQTPQRIAQKFPAELAHFRIGLAERQEADASHSRRRLGYAEPWHCKRAQRARAEGSAIGVHRIQRKRESARPTILHDAQRSTSAMAMSLPSTD